MNARRTMPRRSNALRLLLAFFAGGLVPFLAPVTVGADPGMHCLVGLSDFALESPFDTPFYVATEGDSQATFVVKTFFQGDCTDNVDPWVDYRTENGSALSGSDFQGEPGARVQLEDGAAFVPVPLINDPGVEPVVESFDAVLTNAKSGWVRSPNRGPIYIIDDDGASPRAAFRPVPSFSQNENRSLVKIPVFMAGPIASPVSVSYTVGGSATEVDDYSPITSTLSFTGADRVEVIQFNLSNDSTPEPDETVQITLTDGPDHDLGSPSALTVTILDDDADSTKPRSWFHHPRNGKKYAFGDYRLREMHVFFDDGARGSGVVAVDLALRKRKTSGNCTWYVGGGNWAAGGCSSKRWVPMKFDFDLYLKRFTPPLPSSVGTAIKNYTAWCRATDAAGNVQSVFVQAFNQGSWNTFEIDRR